MNLGIQDGIALADALMIALNCGDEHALLEYEAQRRSVAREVIGMADRLTRLATVPPAMRAARNFLLRTIARFPSMRRRLAMRVSGLALSSAGRSRPTRVLLAGNSGRRWACDRRRIAGGRNLQQ